MPYSFMLMLMQVLLLCFLNCCCIKLGEMGVSILSVVLRVAQQKRDEFCMSTVSLMIYLTGRRANSMYLSVRETQILSATPGLTLALIQLC